MKMIDRFSIWVEVFCNCFSGFPNYSENPNDLLRALIKQNSLSEKYMVCIHRSNPTGQNRVHTKKIIKYFSFH